MFYRTLCKQKLDNNQKFNKNSKIAMLFKKRDSIEFDTIELNGSDNNSPSTNLPGLNTISTNDIPLMKNDFNFNSSSDNIEGKESLKKINDEKFVRKLDKHIIPGFFALFLIAFIDRVNIGSAKVAGIEESLGLMDIQFNIALLVFFVPYVVLEVPSNLLLKYIKPSLWLSIIVFCWGLSTLGIGFAQNFTHLVICRVLIGVFEAGLVPGCIYVISMYYKRYELQKRITFFYCASILAGVLGGVVVYLIFFMDGIANLEGWRWVFIIEGGVTILASIFVYLYIADMPESAKFLTPEERKYVKERQLPSIEGVGEMDSLDKHSIKLIMFDWKLYVGTIAYYCMNYTSITVTLILPSFIAGLDYSPTLVQLVSIPIFLCAAITSISCAFCADRLKRRFPFAFLSTILVVIGYLLVLLEDASHSVLKYVACYFLAAGCFTTQPLLITWQQNNMIGHYKRSISSAVQIGIGNVGGLIATLLFSSSDAPIYFTGFLSGLIHTCICMLAITIYYIGIKIENSLREKGRFNYRLQWEKSRVENLGDAHPYIRFST